MVLAVGKLFFDVALSTMEKNKVKPEIKHIAGQTSLLLKSRHQAWGSGPARDKAKYRHSQNEVQERTTLNTAAKARWGICQQDLSWMKLDHISCSCQAGCTPCKPAVTADTSAIMVHRDRL